MKTTTIKRINLSAPMTEDVSDDLRRELLDVRAKAEDVLGYCPAGPHKREPAETSNELLEALKSLEITILDWRDVLKYQIEKRHAAESDALNDVLLGGEPRFTNEVFSWRETKLSEYRQFIPDYVLQKALAIKEACPAVHFGVVHLEQTRDPFLLAYIGGEYSWQRTAQYWVEVWDEDAFARRND